MSPLFIYATQGVQDIYKNMTSPSQILPGANTGFGASCMQNFTRSSPKAESDSTFCGSKLHFEPKSYTAQRMPRTKFDRKKMLARQISLSGKSALELMRRKLHTPAEKFHIFIKSLYFHSKHCNNLTCKM